MLIGSLQIDLYLHECFSLKEKRFILKSIKTRIRNRFNVSIAEIGYQDKWQRCCLGVACVTNERKQIDKIMSKVMDVIDSDDRIETIEHVMEIL